MAKRDIFGELMEGVEAMKGHRAGKITLRSYKIEAAPLPDVDSKLIRDTRKRLGCSRADPRKSEPLLVEFKIEILSQYPVATNSLDRQGVYPRVIC